VRLVSSANKELNAFLSFKFLQASVFDNKLLLLVTQLSGLQKSEILLGFFFIGFVEDRSSCLIVTLD